MKFIRTSKEFVFTQIVFDENSVNYNSYNSRIALLNLMRLNFHDKGQSIPSLTNYILQLSEITI